VNITYLYDIESCPDFWGVQYFQHAVLAKSTVLCWNMFLCCMYHIMPKIMVA